MLQAERSRVRFPIRSLDFLIDLLVPAAIWPWGRIFLGGEVRPARKVDNLTAIFELSSRKCGNLDVS
jgi:hypothetical protein